MNLLKTVMTSFAFVTVDVVTLSPNVQYQPIKKFHLKFSHFGDWYQEVSNVHKWIEAAKQRGVEDIFSKYEISLGVAERRIDHFESLMNMPAKILCVNLPTLKALHLKMV